MYDLNKFLQEGISSSLAFKNGKKAAIDAIIASRLRHRAQNEARNSQNSLIDRMKYQDIVNKVRDEKVKHLEDLVDNAIKSDDKISIDLHDDTSGNFLNTRSLTADFDKFGHMSLHVIKGESPKLEVDMDGRQKSTGYGENNVFFKNVTGKSLNKVVDDKFKSEKRKVGLLEELVQRSDITTESLFKMWEQRYYAIVCYSGDSRNICLNAVASEYFREFDDDKDNIPEIGPGQKYHEKAIRKYLRDVDKLKQECIESLYKKENIAISEYVLDALRELDNKGYILDLKKSLNRSVLKESEFSDDLRSIYGDLPEIDKIKNVLNDIKDIRYGFINKQNGEEIIDRDWIHGCKNLSDYYIPETDPQKTIDRKLGICQDQSLATDYLFKKYYPELPTQLYALIMPPFGHCVFCFMDDSKWYHLENSWNKEKGLWGPYNSRQDLESHLRDIYIKHHGLETTAKPTVMKFEEYQRMRQGLNESVSEEIRFI